MQDKTTEIFRDAPVPKAVISNIVPSIVSMIMVLVYNLADTFFIGQTKDAYMVAAVSIVTPAFLLFMAVGMLFGIGGTSLISRMLGEGNSQKARNTSSFCFWTGLTIGVIAMVFIWLFAIPVCHAIGASSDTIGYASQYLNIVAVGIPFLIVSNSFSNIIRSEGKAQTAMMGMIIGNMANIILDPIMILGLHWNVAGAAIATVIGNIAAALFYLRHLLSKETMLSIHPKDYMAKNGIAAGVLAIGVPASLNNILMSTSNIITNNIMSQYGDMTVAGLGVESKYDCRYAAHRIRQRHTAPFRILFRCGEQTALHGGIKIFPLSGSRPEPGYDCHLLFRRRASGTCIFRQPRCLRIRNCLCTHLYLLRPGNGTFIRIHQCHPVNRGGPALPDSVHQPAGTALYPDSADFPQAVRLCADARCSPAGYGLPVHLPGSDSVPYHLQKIFFRQRKITGA